MLVFSANMVRKKKGQTPEDMPSLKRLRIDAGLTQERLAKLIPDKSKTKTLTQSAISRWESGKDEPELTVIQMKSLCRALGKSLDELPDDLTAPFSSQSGGEN